MIKIKKKLTVLMVLLSLSLLLAGCSGSKSSTVGTTDKSAAQTTKSNSNITDSNVAKSSNIFGKVESISGNKLTIAIAKQPKRGTKPTQAGNGTNTPSSNGTQGQPPQNSTSPGTQGTSGNSTTRGGTASGSGGIARQMELTGEKQVVVVADDTSISSMSRRNTQGNTTNANNTTKLKLTDIKVGTIVSITLKTGSTDTEKTASAIRVMTAPSK